MNEPGLISLGGEEVLHIEVEGERYQLPADDVRNLLFTGRAVPLMKVHKSGPDEQQPRVTIEGHCALNRSGKAVIFYSVMGHFIIPVVSFRRVARGDAVSAPLFPLVPGEPGGDNE
jgi:hypothetical protein